MKDIYHITVFNHLRLSLHCQDAVYRLSVLPVQLWMKFYHNSNSILTTGCHLDLSKINAPSQIKALFMHL